MIQHIYGKYATVCDGCDAMLPHEDSWEDAQGAMREAGWSNVREGSEWVNYCPECMGETDVC